MICAGIRFNTKTTLLADYVALHRPDLIPLATPIQKGQSRLSGSPLVQIRPLNAAVLHNLGITFFEEYSL